MRLNTSHEAAAPERVAQTDVSHVRLPYPHRNYNARSRVIPNIYGARVSSVMCSKVIKSLGATLFDLLRTGRKPCAPEACPTSVLANPSLLCAAANI